MPTIPLAPSGNVTAQPRPPAVLARSAVIQHNGIRITMELDRNPMPAGEATWVTTEVRNTGSDDVLWFHDGCAISVGVGGEMHEARWRPGRRQIGLARDFKQMALERQALETGVVRIDFVPEQFVGRATFGCADIGIEDRIRPGQVIRQREQWDGTAWSKLGLPPSGPVDVSGSAMYFSRAGAGESAGTPGEVIALHLDGWISNGRDSSTLDPPEAVDAALAVPAFSSWLADKDLRNGNDAFLRYDAATDAWQVGLLEYAPRRLHLALVDPASGLVREIVDRPWDPTVDGYP